MEWREEETTGSTQPENCETSKERKDQCFKGSKTIVELIANKEESMGRQKTSSAAA
jgi:hypothetical protein